MYSSNSLLNHSNIEDVLRKPLKSNIRTYDTRFTLVLPQKYTSDEVIARTVVIEEFNVVDVNLATGYALPNSQTAEDTPYSQYYLYCNNSEGLYKINGEETLIVAKAGEVDLQNTGVRNLICAMPFDIGRNDNALDFTIRQCIISPNNPAGNSDISIGSTVFNESGIDLQGNIRYLFDITFQLLES